MTAIVLAKSMYSEHVVRKSLYWLSETAAWELSDNETSWLVELRHGAPDDVAKLHRLLNDFLLRESIDRSTKGLRAKIISAALSKLGK